MNKTELVAAIKERGGHAEYSTRRLELQQQLQSLMDEAGETTTKVMTDYQKMTIELNKANTKPLLKEHLKKLGINSSENATMLQLRNIAMDKIYDLAVADGTDPIGFGKHGSRSYQEILQEEKGYVDWVITTSREGQANPRLHRLAQWLTLNLDKKPVGNADSPWKKKSASKGAATSPTPPSPQSTMGEGTTQMFKEMMSAIQELKSEVADLQGERRGSRPRRETHGRGHGIDQQLCEGSEVKASEPMGSATPPSTGSRLSELSHMAAQALEDKAWDLVPGFFQALVGQNRTLLMEVGCGPDSQIATAVQEAAGYESAASRCALWNSCDLSTTEGLQLTLSRIDLEDPLVVWMSPPGSAYSPIQNLNSRNHNQQDVLAQKRLAARRVYTSCCVVYQYCVQKGIHVVWEMSDRSLAWRLPIVQRLKQKYELYEAVTKGCAVNLRSREHGPFFASEGMEGANHTPPVVSVSGPPV